MLWATRTRIGIVGLGVISRAYLETLAAASGRPVAAVADLDTRSRGGRRGRACPAPGRSSVAGAARRPRRRHRAEPHDPGRARRDRARRRSRTASTSTARSRSRSTLRAGGAVIGCRGRRRRAARLARPTPCSAPARRPRARSIDEGRIGRPIAATAVMATPGHERGTRTPTSTTCPAAVRCWTWARTTSPRSSTCSARSRAVVGAASRLRGERVIGSGPRAGERIPVEVDTHVTGILEHASGALSTLTTSFDSVDDQRRADRDPRRDRVALGSRPEHVLGRRARSARSDRREWEPIGDRAGLRRRRARHRAARHARRPDRCATCGHPAVSRCTRSRS